MKAKQSVSDNTLERERARVAQELGEAADRVEVARPDWQTMMRHGVLVRLHLRRFRFRAKVNFEDLGLPEPGEDERKQFDEVMTLGVKMLLPARLLKQLDAIDSGARKHLDKWSRKTHWGDFVPVDAYGEWKTGNDVFEQRYLGVRDEIYLDFDKILKELREVYRAQGVKAYARLRNLRPSLLRLRTGRTLTEAEFVSRFVNRVVEAIPDRQTIHDSFAYETELSYIPLPSLLEQDLLERERIAAQRRAEEEEERLREMELSAAQRALRERERMLQRMNEDVVREARAQQEQLAQEFLRGADAQMHAAICETLTNAVESIEKNDGRLVGKVAEQLRNMVDYAAAMNFTGNEIIAGQIAEVRALMEQPKRDAKQVEQLLRRLAAANKQQLRDMEAPARSKRSDLFAVLGTDADDEVPQLRANGRGRRTLEDVTRED